MDVIATVLVSASLVGGGPVDGVLLRAQRQRRRHAWSRSPRRRTPSSPAEDDDAGAPDVFVRDLIAQTTTQVSAGADGPSHAPTITDDGRYVAFISEATNLHPEDTTADADVFVRDLQDGSTRLVTPDADDTDAEAAVIAPAGGAVAYTVPSDDGGDVYRLTFHEDPSQLGDVDLISCCGPEDEVNPAASTRRSAAARVAFTSNGNLIDDESFNPPMFSVFSQRRRASTGRSST